MILNNVANNSVETKSELEVNYITQKKEQGTFLVSMFELFHQVNLMATREQPSH